MKRRNDKIKNIRQEVIKESIGIIMNTTKQEKLCKNCVKPIPAGEEIKVEKSNWEVMNIRLVAVVNIQGETEFSNDHLKKPLIIFVGLVLRNMKRK